MPISVTVPLICGCRREIGESAIVEHCKAYPDCVGGRSEAGKKAATPAAPESAPVVAPSAGAAAADPDDEGSEEGPDKDDVEPVWALSLHRPWGYAILHLPVDLRKEIENRSKPHRTLLKHKFIALHHAQEWDEEGAKAIERITGKPVPGGILSEAEQLGVIGVVTFTSIVERMSFEGHFRAPLDPWFTGPFGHTMKDAKAFGEAIPCKGKQMIPFQVPAPVARKVWAELKK